MSTDSRYLRAIMPAMPELELWAAGDNERGSFAVSDKWGRNVWHDLLVNDHRLHPAWRHFAPTVAAAKALWVAGRVRAHLGVPTILLVLHVNQADLASETLDFAAAKSGVRFTLDFAVDNPAEPWCAAPTHNDWRDLDWASLTHHQEPHRVA